MKYDGIWQQDSHQVWGVWTDINGDEYDGEWDFNQKHGKGVRTTFAGEKYDEVWQNGDLQSSQKQPITALLREEEETEKKKEEKTKKYSKDGKGRKINN